MKTGQQIRFPNEGNEGPDQVTSDIIFIIKETPDPMFKRNNNDLLIEKSIKLGDALCGVKFSIKTLDDRTILIASKPNQVIKPSSIMMVANEGMPINNDKKGNLYVRFTVEFPNEINNNNTQKLKNILQITQYQSPNNNTLKEYKLEPTNKTKFNTQPTRSQNGSQHRTHNGQQMECQNCIM